MAPLSSLKYRALYGQASMHVLHPMHLSLIIRTIPVFLSLMVAFVGQALTHGGLLHWLQSTGINSLVLPMASGTSFRIFSSGNRMRGRRLLYGRPQGSVRSRCTCPAAAPSRNAACTDTFQQPLQARQKPC